MTSETYKLICLNLLYTEAKIWNSLFFSQKISETLKINFNRIIADSRPLFWVTFDFLSKAFLKKNFAVG